MGRADGAAVAVGAVDAEEFGDELLLAVPDPVGPTGDLLGDVAERPLGSGLAGEESPDPLPPDGLGGSPRLVVLDDLAPFGLRLVGQRRGRRPTAAAVAVAVAVGARVEAVVPGLGGVEVGHDRSAARAVGVLLGGEGCAVVGVGQVAERLGLAAVAVRGRGS